jgi:hypothetical protein
LLKEGQISADGEPRAVIKDYLADAHKGNSVSLLEWKDRTTTGEARITRFEIADGDGRPATDIPVRGSVQFSIFAEFYQPLVNPCFGINVYDASGQAILDIRSDHSGLRLGRVTGRLTAKSYVENLGLYPGQYFLSPYITDSASSLDIDCVRACASLEVYPAPGPHGDLKLLQGWGMYWVPSNWVATENS